MREKGIVLAALVLSGAVCAQSQLLVPDGSLYFSGAIDESIPIQVKLREDSGRLSGTYYYQSMLRNLRLRGTIRQDGTLRMKEFDPQGKNTGTFEGVYDREKGEITGTWSGGHGAVQHRFRLRRVVRWTGREAAPPGRNILFPIGRYLVTVEPGDTVGALARRFYGRESMAWVILDDNGLSQPRSLEVGRLLSLPLLRHQLCGWNPVVDDVGWRSDWDRPLRISLDLDHDGVPESIEFSPFKVEPELERDGEPVMKAVTCRISSGTADPKHRLSWPVAQELFDGFVRTALIWPLGGNRYLLMVEIYQDHWAAAASTHGDTYFFVLQGAESALWLWTAKETSGIQHASAASGSRWDSCVHLILNPDRSFWVERTTRDVYGRGEMDGTIHTTVTTTTEVFRLKPLEPSMVRIQKKKTTETRTTQAP